MIAVDQRHLNRFAFDIERIAVRDASYEDCAARFVDKRLVFALLHIMQVETDVVAVELHVEAFSITVIGGDYDFDARFLLSQRHAECADGY